jgi:hypothetical protein
LTDSLSPSHACRRACALLRSARPAAAVTASPSWAALAPLASIHNTAPWEQPASSASWAGGWGRALGGVRSYQHVRPSDWARLLSEGKQRALREQSEAGGMEGAEGAGEEVADDQLEEYEDDETFRLTPPHMILTTDDDKQEYAAALANFSQVVTDEDRKKAATLASAKALADDSWNHVIGRIPDMPYEVPIKDVFAVVLVQDPSHHPAPSCGFESPPRFCGMLCAAGSPPNSARMLTARAGDWANADRGQAVQAHQRRLHVCGQNQGHECGRQTAVSQGAAARQRARDGGGAPMGARRERDSCCGAADTRREAARLQDEAPQGLPQIRGFSHRTRVPCPSMYQGYRLSPLWLPGGAPKAEPLARETASKTDLIAFSWHTA